MTKELKNYLANLYIDLAAMEHNGWVYCVTYSEANKFANKTDYDQIWVQMKDINSTHYFFNISDENTVDVTTWTKEGELIDTAGNVTVEFLLNHLKSLPKTLHDKLNKR